MNSISKSEVSYSAKVFYMFMMFMWVASVSDYTSFNIGKNPVLMPIFLIILIYYYVRYCHKSFRPLWAVLFINIFWNIASYVKYGGFVGINFPPFYSIIIAHVAFNIYDRQDFLRIFEKVLVMFCSLSLIVWLAANVIGTPFVSFMREISVIKPSTPAETYSFLFGLCSHIEMGIRRNLGFTWEPGRFACWVLLGMFVNLIRHQFRIESIWKNKNLYILLFSLLTTLSTTGYSVLGILILFVLINKKSYLSKFVIASIVLLVVPSILSLSFMSEKITDLMDLDAGINAINYYSAEGQEIICPQRFTGLWFSFQNFIHDPWLGFNQLTNSYTVDVIFNHSVIVAPSEGILGIFAKYGILFGAFFYYWLIKSSFLLSKTMQYKGKWMFFIFFIAISLSYDFWENCILMYFYLAAFYQKVDRRYFA